jgi:hypothetical protein
MPSYDPCMSGDSRRRRTRFDFRDESGQVLAFAIGALATLLLASALVLDVGHVFWAKRKLQSSADAAALAGAYDLPDAALAMAAAQQYSGTAGRRNHEIPGTQTDVCITGYPATSTCTPQLNKVIVVERASVNTFFGGLVGIGSYNISARAVASRGSTTVGTPLAVYVHELCGASTGNKGLIINGENAEIHGGIHVNGHLDIGGINFQAFKTASVYRPPPQGTSTATAGKTHSETCKTIDKNPPDAGYSRYCIECATGETTAPSHGSYRDWRTPYHTEAIMKGYTPCTDTTTTKLENVTVPTPTVYCPSGVFEIVGNVNGNITVIGPEIKPGGTGVLRPANPAHPVLFYQTSNKDLVINPSQNYDWNGYIINRFGGIVVNANSVTSPFNGLLESEWILVNGANFEMLGTFPDVTEGGQMGGLTLDE